MADQHNPATTPTHGSGASFADRIELGGTVNDALGVPIGLVHDVDRDRNYLTIDGRPAGFGQYEVPLSTVERVGENNVHLNMVMDTTASSPGSTIRLVPKSQHAQTTHRTPPATPTSTTPTQRVHTAVHVPVDLNQDKSSRGTGMALAGVAAGLAAAGAGYWWWRRTRRKSAMDRTIDFLTSRTPTWWGAAAASTLPVLMPLAVAYARSGRDSTADRVRDRLDA